MLQFKSAAASVCMFALGALFFLGNPEFSFAGAEQKSEILSQEYGVLKIKINNIDGQPSSYFGPTYIRMLFDRLVDIDGPLKAIFYETVGKYHGGMEGYIRGHGVEDIQPPNDRNTVLFKYFRGGANGADGQYHCFLTYVADGSGGETDPVLELVFSVSAEQADSDSVVITTSLMGWREIEGEQWVAFPKFGGSGVLDHGHKPSPDVQR